MKSKKNLHEILNRYYYLVTVWNGSEWNLMVEANKQVSNEELQQYYEVQGDVSIGELGASEYLELRNSIPCITLVDANNALEVPKLMKQAVAKFYASYRK